MLINFFAGLLLVSCAMSALCLGLPKHYKAICKHQPRAYSCRALRISGWLLLIMGFGVCVASWGWAIGPVSWLGQVSLAGLLLAFSLPYRPRLAMAFALLCAPFWLLAWVLAQV